MSQAAPNHKTIVVMPAHNAAKTLEATVGAIPREWIDELILVDDSSTDETLDVAKRLNVETVWHPHNAGYGANQKTCYLHALQRGADIVVMLHPDGQYAPDLIPSMVRPIVDGEADMVLGSRFLPTAQSALDGGMPRIKWYANQGLTALQNRMMGTHLAECHTGYRAYSRELLLQVPWLRNAIGFSFDSEVLYQASHLGFRIAEVPCRTRYFDDASSIKLRPASVYAMKTMWTGVRLLLHRLRLVPDPRFTPAPRQIPPPDAPTIGDSGIPS
ncbi:glycosyltransferase family 2 protein [Patulibacter brassicae]|jgi:glycosyltransferase involved in cell wall biosynthesis|uniref:Glycosyltransferase family 2 protein n=1 Tax=Patulibacter brassicae TaxID=1705717 RepID=A0ABU4VSP0_9ACTN|nr:glycosyltransferase family 2 protein [Patulibacter brassicae]MDX8153903.1 glycosyltransferase family 2 protein [Patulibacter brassicae]